jgi:hypothetical protein
MCNTLNLQNGTKSCYRPYTSNSISVAYSGIFFGGGGVVPQIQLRIEGRENVDVGVVAS